MKRGRRIARALEERTRLDVEIRRMMTSIRDEQILLKKTLSSLEDGSMGDDGRLLGGALNDYKIRRSRVNERIMVYLQRTINLDGFTGSRSCGQRKGSVGTPESSDAAVDGTTQDACRDDEDRDDDDDDDDENDLQMQLDGLVEFMEKLS